MSSLLAQMIRGDVPARFVWQDSLCAAIHSNTPIRLGHCILFPREEVTNWLDLPPDLASHLMATAQKLGRAIRTACPSVRVGLGIIAIQVPHVHVHLVPINTVADFDFSKQNQNPDPTDLDATAEKVRAALRTLGYAP